MDIGLIPDCHALAIAEWTKIHGSIALTILKID